MPGTCVGVVEVSTFCGVGSGVVLEPAKGFRFIVENSIMLTKIASPIKTWFLFFIVYPVSKKVKIIFNMPVSRSRIELNYNIELF